MRITFNRTVNGGTYARLRNRGVQFQMPPGGIAELKARFVAGGIVVVTNYGVLSEATKRKLGHLTMAPEANNTTPAAATDVAA